MVTTQYKIRTLEDVSMNFPALLSTTHDGNRSSRYVTVPTIDIINSMADNNWGIRDVLAPRARKSDPAFNKHLVRFAPLSPDFTLPDPRGYSQGLIPEIVVTNSHNGSSSIKIQAGLFALICSNGLTVTVSNFGFWNHNHKGFNAEDAFRIVNDYRNNISQIGSVITEMGNRILSTEERENFALEVALDRFPEVLSEVQIGNRNFTRLLEPRRTLDAKYDLWSTYNVLQENLVMGGQRIQARKTRALTNINALDKTNDHVWNTALSFLN